MPPQQGRPPIQTHQPTPEASREYSRSLMDTFRGSKVAMGLATVAAIGTAGAAALTGNSIRQNFVGSAEAAAQTSASRSAGPMRPAGVMKRIGKIFEKKQGFLGASGSIDEYIDLTSASATAGTIRLKGDCSEWDPSHDGYFVKFSITKPNVHREDDCSDVNDPWSVRGSEIAHPKDHFAGALNRLGHSAARSARVGRSAVGRTVRASADKKKATLFYRRNTSEQASKRQLRKLVLRRGQSPQKQWHK